MEKTMLQRVADEISERAKSDRDGLIEGAYATRLARHVIEAMREPTIAMIEASRPPSHYRTSDDAWRHMIDAALQG